MTSQKKNVEEEDEFEEPICESDTLQNPRIYRKKETEIKFLIEQYLDENTIDIDFDEVIQDTVNDYENVLKYWKLNY